MEPEDLTHQFVDRLNARDAEGLAALYEPDAVIAFPPGQITAGRDAIRLLYEELVASEPPQAEHEEPLTTLIAGDLALTATPGRAQVVRRQGDGTWLRVLDRPDLTG